jgi:hypothetical protein
VDDLAGVKWTAVQEYILQRGGSKFAFSTAKKRFVEVYCCS